MSVRVRVDAKGRIVIPIELRSALGIREGDGLVVSIQGGKIVVEKSENPFSVLERVLGDLTFHRSLRRIAEKEALKQVKGGGEAL